MTTSEGARFRWLLDLLGSELVEGRWAEGAGDTVDAIVARTGASRTVVREATRVLVSLGMLRASPRTGLRALPVSHWDLLDPQVIQWRLASAGRDLQSEELRGLRLAIEPEAARLAATARDRTRAPQLVEAAESLATATATRDRAGFLDADRRFHGALLAIAGNPMLTRLGAVVDEALEERTPDSSIRWEDAPDDVAAHAALAAAVVEGDGDRAFAIMRGIVADDGRR